MQVTVNAHALQTSNLGSIHRIKVAAVSLLLVCLLACLAQNSVKAETRLPLCFRPVASSPQDTFSSLFSILSGSTIDGRKLRGLPARPASLQRLAVQSLPIDIFCTPNTVSGGTNFGCTITVNQAGGSILVSCDHPSLLVSPSGSWPYTLNYPSGGSTVATFTIGSNGVSSDTPVKIYACESDWDITNPANWQVVTTVTLTHSTSH